MQQLTLRIILSPFIFLYGIFLLAAMTLFPIPLLIIMSFIGLIGTPIIWLLNKSGADIEYMEPFININNDNESDKYKAIGHFLGVTIYVWAAFAIVYYYIKTGEVFTGD